MALTLNGDDGIAGVNGSATTPALQGTDTNTGISFGTDTVNVVTGGSTRATVDSNGRLGIGTTSPSFRLHSYDTSAAQGFFNGWSAYSTFNSSGAIRLGDQTGYQGRIDYDGGTTNFIFENSYSSGLITWKINNTERMRIASDGKTGVFATNNHVFSAATNYVPPSLVKCFVAKHSATSTTNGTESFNVLSNGNVLNTNNSYGALSDFKLKENIVDASSQWDDLKAIQVRNYNFKEETGHQTHTQLGVVAQEVELVSPGLVSESPDVDEDGNDLGTVTKSVNYSVLYMKSVKALQEAMERIEQLETRVAQLEGGAS